MTALVRREVKQTFSRFSRFLTGLSALKTLKAGRQNLGNFVEPVFDFEI
jgi:hypothetical protein